MVSVRNSARSVTAEVYNTALDRSSPRNWLDDNMWLMPTALDPFQLVPRLPNEDRVPERALRELASSNLVQIAPWQVGRAVWPTSRHLDD